MPEGLPKALAKRSGNGTRWRTLALPRVEPGLWIAGKENSALGPEGKHRRMQAPPGQRKNKVHLAEPLQFGIKEQETSPTRQAPRRITT
jgi:hypothetical protein